MLVYRLSQTKYADDLSGEGARLYGGRWNLPLVACLYTSESRALALLEYSVNVNIYEIPRALSFITLEIDEELVYKIDVADLPGNWKDNVVPRATQELGTHLLFHKKIPVIRVPSVVVPEEFNYLINPEFYEGLKVVKTGDYAYDVSVKLK